MTEEEVLLGGNMGIVSRVGSTVRRPSGPWTPAVHALLAYLAAAGFAAAPRPLGVDEAGREMLTFIEGDTVMTPIPARVWFDSMTDAALLLRRFHDLSLGFRSPDGAVWRDQPADPGLPEVICHSDWAHYNGVWRTGRLIGIIDWDFARPGSRLYDLAWFALTWCPLSPPDRTDPDLAATIDQPRRLRELCDAYGLADRGGLLEAIQARVGGIADWIEARADAGDPVYARMVAERHPESYRQVLAHLDRNWDKLAAALV